MFWILSRHNYVQNIQKIKSSQRFLATSASNRRSDSTRCSFTTFLLSRNSSTIVVKVKEGEFSQLKSHLPRKRARVKRVSSVTILSLAIKTCVVRGAPLLYLQLSESLPLPSLFRKRNKLIVYNSTTGSTFFTNVNYTL